MNTGGEREVMGKPLGMGSRTQVVASAFSRKRATLFSEARENKGNVEQGKSKRLREYYGLNFSIKQAIERQVSCFFKTNSGI